MVGGGRGEEGGEESKCFRRLDGVGVGGGDGWVTVVARPSTTRQAPIPLLTTQVAVLVLDAKAAFEEGGRWEWDDAAEVDARMAALHAAVKILMAAVGGPAVSMTGVGTVPALL